MEEMKTMKKKLLTTVLAAVLCLGMSVTAMAAPSPSVDNSKPASQDNRVVTSTTTAGGVSVEQKALQQSDLTGAQKNVLGVYFTAMSDIDKDADATPAQKNERKAAYVQSMIKNALGVNANFKSGVYGAYELEASQVGKEIPVAVAGVNAGDKVVIAHLKDDGTWENVPATKVENGVVYAVFNSFSPVFVAVTGSGAATSPKTADAGMGMLFVVFVAAAAGAVVYARRRMNYAK